jgi:pimeloyl-ACP methyl ester carboxylesterase
MSDAEAPRERSGWVRTRDGRQLWVERHGRGEPTVVFEAGMGGSRNCWGGVVDRVAPTTATVVYDRSGLGRSPRDPARRDVAHLADDLVDLLDDCGDGPLILVGHSWGGPIVRCAAALRPERIVGLVLVDQTDEGCELFLSETNERRGRFFERVSPVVARLGLGRLLARRMATALPEPWATAMRAEDGTATALQTHAAEMATSSADLRRLAAEPPEPPDVPLVVISGTVGGRLERNQRDALVAAHRARADAAPQGRHVLATRSGHMVPFTEPDVIAAEILRLVADRRGTADTV